MQHDTVLLQSNVDAFDNHLTGNLLLTVLLDRLTSLTDRKSDHVTDFEIFSNSFIFFRDYAIIV